MPLSSDSSKSFYYDIDLQKNTLFNAKIQPVSTAERSTLAGTLNANDKGLIVFDTNELTVYSWDGNNWKSFGLNQTQLNQIAAAYAQTVTAIQVSRTETLETISLTTRDGQSFSASFSYAYIHNQTIASASWQITHNLGRFPSVTIVDSANSEVIGEVAYNSNNQLTVSFSAAFSGKAYLN